MDKCCEQVELHPTLPETSGKTQRLCRSLKQSASLWQQPDAVHRDMKTVLPFMSANRRRRGRGHLIAGVERDSVMQCEVDFSLMFKYLSVSHLCINCMCINAASCML